MVGLLGNGRPHVQPGGRDGERRSRSLLPKHLSEPGSRSLARPSVVALRDVTQQWGSVGRVDARTW